MNSINWSKDKIRSRLADFVRREVQKSVDQEVLPIISQLVQFQNSGAQDRQSYYDHTKSPLENHTLYVGLRDRLEAISVAIQDVDIDISDFENWLRDFPEIKRYYQTMGDVFIEKCLEHYLAFRQLNVVESDVFVDIAAGESPWTGILNSNGIKSYRLDFAYPEGMHGVNIGADAGDTKLPDEFASVLSLHSAFECFMGDADIQFVREAARILNKGGRYGIVPLFLDDAYFNSTSPDWNQRDVVIDPGAKKVWRDDEYRSPFSRHYSPESFGKRIFENIPEIMTGKVLYFRNLTEVMKYYQGQRIYCFFMFYCTKTGK